MTLDEAKLLRVGQRVIDVNGKRWKINGKVRTWKRNPNRIEIPVKHGLYVYGYINQHNLDMIARVEA
jgi:hypothetical protein